LQTDVFVGAAGVPPPKRHLVQPIQELEGTPVNRLSAAMPGTGSTSRWLQYFAG
jgi:hypothetical protein